MLVRGVRHLPFGTARIRGGYGEDGSLREGEREGEDGGGVRGRAIESVRVRMSVEVMVRVEVVVWSVWVTADAHPSWSKHVMRA